MIQSYTIKCNCAQERPGGEWSRDCPSRTHCAKFPCSLATAKRFYCIQYVQLNLRIPNWNFNSNWGLFSEIQLKFQTFCEFSLEVSSRCSRSKGLWPTLSHAAIREESCKWRHHNAVLAVWHLGQFDNLVGGPSNLWYINLEEKFVLHLNSEGKYFRCR